ncbi:hypothetical protein STEG23_022045, partial [Scotinomys teguina]
DPFGAPEVLQQPFRHSTQDDHSKQPWLVYHTVASPGFREDPAITGTWASELWDLSSPEFGDLLFSCPELWDQSSLELVPDIRLTLGTGKLEQFLSSKAVKTPAVAHIDSSLQSQRL